MRLDRKLKKFTTFAEYQECLMTKLCSNLIKFLSLEIGQWKNLLKFSKLALWKMKLETNWSCWHSRGRIELIKF